MKTLMVHERGVKNLALFARTFGSVLSLEDSVQILPVNDLSPAECEWADWLMLGASWSTGAQAASNERIIASLRGAIKRPRLFTLFQLQARSDPPISAAYGYAIGRQLRQSGLIWLAPPIVFFARERGGSELEGELLRAGRWFSELAKVADRTMMQDS